MTKKRKPTDTTLRNARASFRRDELLAQQIDALRRDVARLRYAFNTSVAWIASSAGSPLTAEHAKNLIELADPKD